MTSASANVNIGSNFTTHRMIYVVDDDGDLRRSLDFFLATRGISVVQFASGTEFLCALENLQPAPVILDVRMPDVDGTQVLQELAQRQIHWPVVMLSGHGEVQSAVLSLRAGAIDFLEKPVSATDLTVSVEAAFERLALQTASKERRDEAARRLAVLTPREIEVLGYLTRGRSNKQVAFDLSISPRTVEMHRANAFRQLGVRTLVEVIALRATAAA